MSFTEYLGQRFIFPRPQAFGRLRLVQKPLDKAMAQQGPRVLEGRLSLQPGGAKMEAAALRHFCGCPARGWDSWINCTVGRL